MNPWIKAHPDGFLLILFCFIAGLWILIMYFIASFGGWKTLAERFRLQGDFTGQRRSWQSAQMRGSAAYNNCLVVGPTTLRSWRNVCT
jgi:hypothetical protein